jgi:hypothetical protein
MRRTCIRVLTLLLGAGGGACATPLLPLPLRPEPVPWADTLPIPEPESRDEGRILRSLTLHVPYDLAEDLKVSEGEALNRTHFDDAVSSSWWERRMGYTNISPEALAAGPIVPGAAPDTDGVLRVRSAKVDGATPGFVMEDAKGDIYIVKFDPHNVPYLQSSVGVIVNRLMWGAGYWVPEDFLATLDSTNLTLAEDAEAEVGGTERPMTMDDVHTVLARAATLPDGRFRILASKFVPGAPKGPSFMIGVRSDDPNDHFRHEHRRELRGLRVISSWLNDTDRREGNTLDVYVEPGYLRHYQIDFGASLGSSTDRPKHPKDDVERPADVWRAVARFASLGFYREGWEDDPHPVVHPGLGYVKAEAFDPDEWITSWDNPAFFAMTPADSYWGAKIVSAFTDEHLRSVVDEGRLPEPWLADTLTHVLTVRRDAVVRRFFSSVTPIEDPRVAAAEGAALTLAFRDLGIERDVWEPGQTRYTWTLSHPSRGIERSGEASARAGEQQIRVSWPEGAPPADGLSGEAALAVVRVLAVRDLYHMDDEEPRAATIWLRWNGASGRYEVVGLEH